MKISKEYFNPDDNEIMIETGQSPRRKPAKRNLIKDRDTQRLSRRYAFLLTDWSYGITKYPIHKKLPASLI
jgi:hypothetical protein